MKKWFTSAGFAAILMLCAVSSVSAQEKDTVLLETMMRHSIPQIKETVYKVPTGYYFKKDTLYGFNYYQLTFRHLFKANCSSSPFMLHEINGYATKLNKKQLIDSLRIAGDPHKHSDCDSILFYSVKFLKHE